MYAFLPLCLLAYRLARSVNAKNIILLVASLIFYALGEPVYIVLLIVAAASAFFFAFKIDDNRGTGKARLFLAVSVFINISFLFFFKYAPFFVETASGIFNLGIQTPRIKLPIGISFYTFQILTYTIDIYRGKVKLQTSPVKFFLYVSMFSQLIAGPILRYNDVEAQLDRRYINAERFASGILRFVCGLAKKVLLADYAGGIANTLLGAAGSGAGGAGAGGAGASQWLGEGIREGLGITGGTLAGGLAGVVGESAAGANALGAGALGAGAVGAVGISTPAVWIGLILFGFQIYFDFSGYSDMAIGLGRLFGFEFLENFRHPFYSKSITEFWRRWHISLGAFFRDYVYIPLGGNRRLQIRNIAVVWMLTGLWHGASWNFVIWGSYFGILLIAEKYLAMYVRVKPPVIAQWFICFFIVTVSWGLFYYSETSQIINMFSAMFVYKPETDAQIIRLITDNLLFLAVCFFAAMPWAKQLYERAAYWCERRNGQAAAIADSALSFIYAAALLIVCSVVRVGSSFSPNIYLRFYTPIGFT
jgi:alginate O-acetyltransferase complex protein AlgI